MTTVLVLVTEHTARTRGLAPVASTAPGEALGWRDGLGVSVEAVPVLPGLVQIPSVQEPGHLGLVHVASGREILWRPSWRAVALVAQRAQEVHPVDWEGIGRSWATLVEIRAWRAAFLRCERRPIGPRGFS